MTPDLFALVVESHEELAYDGSVMTPANTRFWVLCEPEGWGEATSCRCDQHKDPPKEVLTFNTLDSAVEFAKRWEGHPWWCRPNGVYEVVPVRALYTGFTGYERLETP